MAIDWAKWREALAASDGVYVLSRGGFSNTRTYRVGEVIRRTPTQIIIKTPGSRPSRERRFCAKSGTEVGDTGYLLSPEPQGRPAFGETE